MKLSWILGGLAGAIGLGLAYEHYKSPAPAKPGTQPGGKPPVNVTPGPQPITTDGHRTVNYTALSDLALYSVYSASKFIAGLPSVVELTDSDSASPNDPGYQGNAADWFFYQSNANGKRIFVAPDFAQRDPDIRYASTDAAPQNWLEVVYS
jgi:hypothetical protein